MTMTVHVVVAVLLLATWSEATPCSNPDSDTFVLNDCLNAIRTEAEDRNKFWFGEEYAANCGDESQFYAECFNPINEHNDSLVSRLFRDRAYDGNNLDTFINVVYDTKSGAYEGCGNTYYITDSRTVTVDPLSDDQDLKPFELRSFPQVSWDRGENDTTLYTLALVDAGYGALYGLVVNVPGDDIGRGHVIIKYKHPDNPTDNPNPYVFLLFAQKHSFEVQPMLLKKLVSRDSEGFEIFMDATQVVDTLVGMTWVTVRGDAESAKRDRSPFPVNNCARFVDEAFQKKQIDFLPKDKPELSVYIEITQESEEIEFRSCCHDYYYPHHEFQPNPIGDKKAPGPYVRNDAVRNFTFTKSTAFPHRQRDFKGELHALLMIDPSVPKINPAGGNSSRPYNHMVVVNIREGDFETGDVISSYDGPWPMDNAYHTYYFMLFKQSGKINPQLEHYTNPACTGGATNRCGLEMAPLIRDYDLELVGATWQLSYRDEYARYKRVSLLGFDEATECEVVPDYTPKC